MAQESFLKWLNSRFIAISAFKCHFMWRVDLLTGGSSFLYQYMCVIMTQTQTFSRLRRGGTCILLPFLLLYLRLSVSCSQHRPLQNHPSSLSGEIRIHHTRELCARGEFKAIPRRRLKSIPARAHSSVFGKSLSLSRSSLRIIIPDADGNRWWDSNPVYLKRLLWLQVRFPVKD